MKKALLFVFFLVFAYPEALIYQAIAGAFGGWLVATILGTNAGSYATGIIGPLVFIALGFLVYKFCRPNSPDNKAGMLLVFLAASALHSSCTPQLASTTPKESEIFRDPTMVTDSIGWTGPKLVSAR